MTLNHTTYLLVSARESSTASTLFAVESRSGATVLAVQAAYQLTALLPLRGAHGGLVAHYTHPLLCGTLGGALLLTDLAVLLHVTHARMQFQHVTGAEPLPPHVLPLLVVNRTAHSGEHLQYPTGATVSLLKARSVSVTALVESAHGVGVGFNFGCFQLWSLASLTCLLASDLHGKSTPRARH